MEHHSRIIASGLLAGILMAAGTVSAASRDQQLQPEEQFNPIAPLGEVLPRQMNSGVRANFTDEETVVYSEVVHTPDAAWTRLFFSELTLEGDSRIRFTSLFDGDVQELDAEEAAMWSNSSAFFNGDAVLVELIAAPGTQNNLVTLESVQVDLIDANDTTTSFCGICGDDTRVPSNELWAGRLLYGGVCSAAVYNPDSCIVTAGHCIGGGSGVIQFNVPNSSSFNGNINHPSATHQYPVTSIVTQSGNPGVGNDWAVGTTGSSQGLTIYERYGQYRPLASSVPSSGTSQVWGYGSSKTNTLNHVQQLSEGSIISLGFNTINHRADTTGGNSGSAILHNNQIIGIVTHCSSNCPPGTNTAQRITTTALQNTINDVCPQFSPPSNDCCETAPALQAGSTEFSTLGATTCGFNEGGACDLFGDTNVQSDIWYRHTTQCTGQLTVSVCDSDFVAKIAVYQGSCPSGPGEVIACDVNSCADTVAGTVTIDVEEGQLYRIRIGGHLGATGDGFVQVTCDEFTEPACPGDLTGSGEVNVDDLLVVLNNWGSCPGGEPGCNGDANDDGEVNVDDLLIILNNWGDCS